MATKLFVNVQASSIASALVRAVNDKTPVGFPTLVIGDDRDYEIYFTDGLGNFTAWSGDASYTPFFAIGDCGYPTGGSFTLQFGANTTAAQAYNVSTAALQTALQGLASIGSGNILVTGVAGKYYEFEFVGALAGANQSELIVGISALDGLGEVSTLQDGAVGINEEQLLDLSSKPIAYADNWTPITNGWAGTLSTNSLAALQAFVAAGSTSITKTFQVTVSDPDGDRTTYVKTPATIECTIISPEAYAGDEKPNFVTADQLAAAVLGLNNFTRESLTSTTAGNTNITRPSTSRHHSAVVAVTGAASTRTLSVLTSSSPNAGDTVLLSIEPNTTAGNIIEVRNATSGGALLDTFTTTTSAAPIFLVLVYSGSAWGVFFSENRGLSKSGNLAGLANVITARGNLKTLFSRVVSKTADFTIASTEDGTLFPVSTSGGSVVATLPAHAAGLAVAIQKSDGSSNVVTTSPATLTLVSANSSVVLVSDGSTWQIATAYNPIDGGNALTLASNSTGNTILTPVAPIHTNVMTVTGAASTRIFSIAATGQVAGNIVKVRLLLPATSLIAIEIRNASDAGTVLYDYTTDGSGDDAYFELYFDGSAWQKLFNVIPAY